MTKMRNVGVPFTDAEIEYIRFRMLTDEMCMGRTNGAGAATVVRHVVLEAMAAHKKANPEKPAPIPDVQPGWPDKSRLMAGR